MPWFIVFMVVFVFIFYFVWKLCAALIYSWLGLLFNFLRHPRLGYEAIFKVSVFAVTPWFLIQLLALVIPPLDLARDKLRREFYLCHAGLDPASRSLELDPGSRVHSPGVTLIF